MESEKVKEIKEALECCVCSYFRICKKCPYGDLENCKHDQMLRDTLTLINELESENERLNKSDTSKEESSIEYYNLYKDLKRKNKDLNELCELQRVSIAESFVRENQLKDRIAELEKVYDRQVRIINDLNIEVVKEQKKLPKFAEMLKAKMPCEEVFKGIWDKIDETLKEFINTNKGDEER